MKILLVFPPIAPPISPYLSTPLLAGQLVANGYNAINLDLSVEFFHHILTPEYLENSYKKAIKRYNDLENVVVNCNLNIQKFKQLPFKEQIQILRKYSYNSSFPTEDNVIKTIQNIPAAMSLYHDMNAFYNIEEREKQMRIINDALSIASLPYLPAKCHFEKYANDMFSLNYKEIKYQVDDTENNIFIDFYLEKIKEHNLKDYDMICVSFPNLPQIVPAFTLCKMLKEHTKAKIVIGGNIVNRLDSEIKREKDAFNTLFDFVLCGCGEESIVKLARCLENKDSFKNVKGLMYKSPPGQIIYNKTDYEYEINNSKHVSLNGIDLEKYFTPEIIFPIQATKGCYWGKCLFCGLHYPKKKFTQKNVKSIVDEIEMLNKNYGINNFEFIDEALKTEFLSELADEIIKRNLDIKYYVCSRLENGYNEELCNKLYLSGLRVMEIGFESACERVYKKLNKGIDFHGRKEILKSISKSGIWTYLYAIIGYPDETKEEAMKTINFQLENRDCADSFFIHKFWLDKKAPIYNKYLLNNILFADVNKKDIYKQSVSDFFAPKQMSKESISELYELFKKNNPQCIGSVFAPDEYFFLYIGHYGKDMKTLLK